MKIKVGTSCWIIQDNLGKKHLYVKEKIYILLIDGPLIRYIIVQMQVRKLWYK